MKTTCKPIAFVLMALMVSAFCAVADQNPSNPNEIGQPQKALGLLGKDLKNGAGETIGKLGNIIVDLESGRVLYGVVVLPDGRKVAVPPGKFIISGNNLVANVAKDRVAAAPVFDPGQAESTAYAQKVYQHFDQPMWFQGGDASSHFGNAQRLTDLIGMTVKDVSNNNFGKINNVVVDMPASRVLYVVFAPTGDLGKNNDVYLMPPNAFTMGADKKLVTGVDATKLQGAPHFRSGSWPTDFGSKSYASQIYNYYGKQPYFQ
jgi:sporulation protein YlmC with PRC-barrel domain